MSKPIKYILMNRDDEVLSFEIKFGKCDKVKIIEKLAHFDKAPYGMDKDAPEEALNNKLLTFLNRRSIAPQRWDYADIIKYTGCLNSLELSFKGHGLSLSNHYWYKKEDEDLKYQDINFFANKWDDSFARAVLSGDYKALKNVSLNVPDVVTAGWGIKGWLCEDDGPRLYKLGIAQDHYEEVLAEVLTSRLAKRILNKDDVLEYELKEIYGKYASASKCLINVDEELIPLSRVIPQEVSILYHKKNTDRDIGKKFFNALKSINISNLYEFFVKMSCLRSISFANDLHFDNLSAIRNINTGKMRVAPMFDLGSSFGSSINARKMLSNINKGVYVIIYYMYSDLDPDWDYSWYHEQALDGFEDEIKEMLSKSEFYTPQLIDNIIDVYHHQKESLHKLAKHSTDK